MTAPYSLTRFWGIVLLAAALLLGIPSFGHPLLHGDAGTQLAKIAATPAWRSVHWSFSLGYVVSLAALAGVSGLHAGTPGAPMTGLGVILAAFGYAVSALGVLFMLSTADALAGAHARQGLELAGGDPRFMYEMLHPFALAALRVGAFAVSLGVGALGWGVKCAMVWRPWVGWSAVGAGLMGAAAALAFPERSPVVVLGVALTACWQAAVGVVLLRRTKAPRSH
jgi:hypothetical protein